MSHILFNHHTSGLIHVRVYGSSCPANLWLLRNWSRNDFQQNTSTWTSKNGWHSHKGTSLWFTLNCWKRRVPVFLILSCARWHCGRHTNRPSRRMVWHNKNLWVRCLVCESSGPTHSGEKKHSVARVLGTGRAWTHQNDRFLFLIHICGLSFHALTANRYPLLNTFLQCNKTETATIYFWSIDVFTTRRITHSEFIKIDIYSIDICGIVILYRSTHTGTKWNTF